MTAPSDTFWSVEEAVDMSPPPRFTKVEVETPVYEVAWVKGNACAPVT